MELYLEDKAREFQHSTVRSHRSRLGFFVDWCDEQDVENLLDCTERSIIAVNQVYELFYDIYVMSAPSSSNCRGSSAP